MARAGEIVDRAGMRFGRLVAVRYVGKHGSGGSLWLCRCDCGTERAFVMSRLTIGETRSCGCLRQGRSRVRRSDSGAGLRSRPEYGPWCHMRGRCEKPEHKNYALYGGRGIRVCDRWQEFANFLADMGDRPPGGTLDRIDVNGNYEPSNCRWATQKEQTRNKRTNHLIEYQGTRKPIGQWAEELGIPYNRLWQRLVKLQWTAERAFNA